MSQAYRHIKRPHWRLNPIAASIALLCLSGNTWAADASLTTMDTAGTRLGWLSSAEIAALPEIDQPRIDPTCAGAWVTPIGPKVVAGDFNASEILANADSLNYSENGEAQLSGSVRLQQNGRLIEADSGTLSQDREFAQFDGNIRLAEPGLLMTAEQAVFNLNTQAGQLLSSEFVASDLNAHGRAERIRRLDDGVILIDRGIYTTCAPGQRSWAFDARDIELNQETGVGKVYHAKLRIADVPVLYLPYFRFPIDDRRQTGLLVPRFGTTSDGGLDFSQPIYFNLAPNYDATITPRVVGRRGVMLGGEFRYLTQNYGQGIVEGNILPDDKNTGEDRKSGRFQHSASWNNGFSARADVNYVSDNLFFTDLGTSLVQSATTHQERVGEVIYRRGPWEATTRVQGFQTIDPSIADGDKPYSRMPQLLLTRQQSLAAGWQPDLRAEVANFRRSVDDGSIDINGVRMRLDPRMQYEFSDQWGFVRPAVKLTHLQYALEGEGVGADKNPSVTIPTISLDTGLYFDRPYSNGLTQTLEPRLYYLYAPFKDQSENPNFDSANTTFSYDQLFRDTRFSGGDRVDDANQVAYGFTSRFISEDGFEHLQASVGQIVYFRDRRVALPLLDGSSPVGNSDSSSFAGNITTRVNENLSAYADFLMDPADSKLSQYSVAANLQLPGGRLYNAGYRFRRDDPSIGQRAVSQTHLSFVHPIGAHWKTFALWQYNLKDEESQEALFGVGYESCCWEVRLFKRSFLADPNGLSDSSDRSRSAIFLEVSLKGLASIQSGVNALLEQSVFGYSQLSQREDRF